MSEYHSVGFGTTSGDIILATTGIATVFTSNSAEVEGTGLFNVNIDAATNTTEAWFTTFAYRLEIGGSGAADNAPIQIFDRAGQLVFDILITNNGTNPLYRYWNGAAMTNMAADSDDRAWAEDIQYKWDIHINLDGGGAGFVNLYRNDKLLLSVTGLSNSGSFLDRMELRSSDHDSSNFRNRFYYHEMCVGIGPNSPTLGRRVFSRRLTGDAAAPRDAWTGTFADIDDGPTVLDGNAITSDTVSAINTSTISAATADNTLAQVSINAIAQSDGAGVLNYQLMTHQGGTNYIDATVQTPGVATDTIGSYHMNLNPATGLPWTVAEFNAAEYGVSAGP